MIILSQCRTAAINSEYAEKFYITTDEAGAHLLQADLGSETLTLGTYANPSYAKHALEFICTCMVDENAQGKITLTPTDNDLLCKTLLGASKDTEKALHSDTLEAILEGTLSDIMETLKKRKSN